MLKITTQASNISIINTFNQSSIKKRIIMLNTNQSNRKNIWKIALILPIIVGFIYLFQVKVVAQERIKIEENKNQKHAIVDSAVAVGEGYTINKYSTDEEMNNDAASLMKEHNIDYKFSNIKRNEKDEIIAIKVEFNDNNGHKGEKVVNGTDPIKPIHFTIDIDKNGKKQFGFYKFIMPKGKNIRNFVFDFFEINKVALYDEEKIAELLQNPGIIRNKLKVNAAIHNANVILDLQKQHGSFKNWIEHHHPKTKEEWVKIFKKTFKFTGGEIVNEFLMSTGYLPGAHDPDCEVGLFLKQKEVNQ